MRGKVYAGDSFVGYGKRKGQWLKIIADHGRTWQIDSNFTNEDEVYKEDFRQVVYGMSKENYRNGRLSEFKINLHIRPIVLILAILLPILCSCAMIRKAMKPSIIQEGMSEGEVTRQFPSRIHACVSFGQDQDTWVFEPAAGAEGYTINFKHGFVESWQIYK